MLRHPHPCLESFTTRDDTGLAELPLVAISDALDPDLPFLRLRRHFDLTLLRRALVDGHLLKLKKRPLDLVFGAQGKLCSQVLIAMIIVRAMRIPVFLELNEAQEAGLLC